MYRPKLLYQTRWKNQLVYNGWKQYLTACILYWYVIMKNIFKIKHMIVTYLFFTTPNVIWNV